MREPNIQNTLDSQAVADTEQSTAPAMMASYAGAKRVFVSYASADIAIAHSLVEQLEEDDITCWIAPRNIVPGCLYADCIIDAINQASVMVVVLSRDSIASSHVGKEIERASSKGRPIIVLRIDKSALTRSLEYFLSESQWVDWPTSLPAAAFANLRAAIARHSDSVNLAPSVATARSTLPGSRRRWPELIVVAALAAVFIWLIINLQARRQTTAPVTLTDKSVAVLPFVDMSEKKDQDYFSDGLAEELIDQLSRISGLHVSARTSSFSFKNKQSNIGEIARALGVSTIVEGSVRKAGTMLRITAQLVRGDTGFEVWSATYSRPQDDIFKIQDEIASAIVKELTGTLLTTKSSTVASTDNPLTYDLLLKGQYFLSPVNASEAEKAVTFFQQAVESDPKSAKGWAGLSRATVNLHNYGLISWSAAREAGLRDAQHAIQLNPLLADAHIALGKVYKNLDRNFASSSEEFAEAYSLEPNNPYTMFWMGNNYVDGGDLEKAVQLLKQSVVLDPFNIGFYEQLAWAQYCKKAYREAEATMRHLLELSPSDPGVHAMLGFTLLKDHRIEDGFAEIQLETDPEQRAVAEAWARQFTGQVAEGEKALSELKEKYADTEARSIASIYAMRGKADQAFEWLDRAYQQHEPIISIKVDPDFELVRSDPRFREWLLKMKIPPG